MPHVSPRKKKINEFWAASTRKYRQLPSDARAPDCRPPSLSSTMNTAILRRAGGGRALAWRLTAAPRAAPAAVRNYGDKAKSTEELFETPPLPLNKQYRAPKGWDDPQMRRNFGDPVRQYT